MTKVGKWEVQLVEKLVSSWPHCEHSDKEGLLGYRFIMSLTSLVHVSCSRAVIVC